jgi:hypothetical protein
MLAILDLRLPQTGSSALVDVAETSGWLGNRATGEAAPWAEYAGDQRAASWFPTQATADAWENFPAVRTATLTALSAHRHAQKATMR